MTTIMPAEKKSATEISTKAKGPEPSEGLEKLINSEVYKDNVCFWERAWGGVKTAYTQMPELPYLPLIPETLEERGAKKVLDLGCGSGWLSVFLARHGFVVTGIDISQHAVNLGRAWAQKEDLTIDFQAMDIANLVYDDGGFEAIVANSIFEHFPLEASRDIFKLLKSVLKPGGTLIACFDEVGMGAGEYFKLDDDTHVYTDKARKGMLLRNYSDSELKELYANWTIDSITPLESGSRYIVATNK